MLRKLETKPAAAKRRHAASDTRQPTPAAPAAPAGNPALRGFLWGAGSMAALAFLGFFVWNSAKQRGAGDSATGNPGGPMQAMQPPQPPQQQAQSDPELQQLEGAVAKSPEDVSLRDELAKAYLDRENMMGVFEQTKVALQKAPNDSRALTYQALVRLAMGQSGQAISMLEQATKSDPNLLDAWIGLAWVQMRSGKDKDAERSIAEAAKRHPEDAARLNAVLQQMRVRAGQTEAVAAKQRNHARDPVLSHFANPSSASAKKKVRVESSSAIRPSITA